MELHMDVAAPSSEGSRSWWTSRASSSTAHRAQPCWTRRAERPSCWGTQRVVVNELHAGFLGSRLRRRANRARVSRRPAAATARSGSFRIDGPAKRPFSSSCRLSTTSTSAARSCSSIVEVAHAVVDHQLLPARAEVLGVVLERRPDRDVAGLGAHDAAAPSSIGIPRCCCFHRASDCGSRARKNTPRSPARALRGDPRRRAASTHSDDDYDLDGNTLMLYEDLQVAELSIDSSACAS